MPPSRSRQQQSTAAAQVQTPPTPCRKSERGVIKSVLLTFFFHVAALLFGAALLFLLALTAAGLGLVLLCICSGSSRSVRVLVASLWRAELWINSLGVDQAKRENAALDAQTRGDSHSHFEEMARAAADGGGSAPVSDSRTGSSRSNMSRAGSSSVQRGREVTPSVMVLSLMYFLLFKWIFNIIFSTIPLVFWGIAIAQFTPLNEQLDADVDLAEGNRVKYFVGIAVAFLAHQIAVTAAIGSVFVSEKMAGFLFEEASREENSTYAPLLHWNAGQGEVPSHMYQYHSAMDNQSVFGARPYEDTRPPFTAPQSTPASYQNPFNSRLDDQQLLLSRNISDFNPRASSGSATSLPESGSLARPLSGGAQPSGSRLSMPPIPPMPPFPPFPPAPPTLPFGAPHNNLESVYRGQVEERVVDCCLFKVHVKRTNDDSDHGGHGGRGGRGPSGGRGGHGRDRGRGGGRGGRGGLRVESPEHDRGYHFHFEVNTCDDAPRKAYTPAAARASARRPGGEDRFNGDRNEFDVFALQSKVERHELKRTKSFESLRASAVGEDLELPPHMRMYEVLDLSPSAPPLHPAQAFISSRRGRFSRTGGAEFPMARLADDQMPQYPTGSRHFDLSHLPPNSRLHIQKSNSDEGRYADQKVSVDQLRRGGSEQQRDQTRYQQRQMEQQSDQASRQLEQVQRQREQAARQREQLERRRLEGGRLMAVQSKDQAQRTQSLPVMNSYPETAGAVSPTSYRRELEVYKKEQEYHHAEITQAALEGIEKAKLEEEQLAESGALRTTLSGRRYRAISSGDSSAQAVNAPVSDTRFIPRGDQRRISFTGPYQAGASDVSDYDIHNQFGSLPQTFEENSFLDAFRPPGQSSSETITTLSDEPRFRGTSSWTNGPSYNAFSPPISPTSTSNGSFLLGAASVYDLYSPTNSMTQDDDNFPSDQLPPVYRSIRYSGPPPALMKSRFAEFDDVPGRRDKVHFNAFAPPSVAPSSKPFHYTVWAFLLNQRDEMREKAEIFDPAGRKLTVDTKLDIRRGALVHVTLETPEGFRVVDGGATQGFPWEGKICNATFNVQCTDGAGFGSVLFKATIIVGTEVAVLRSYVNVSSSKLDPTELEAQMLNSKLEVLEKTFEEIPYKSLEMKELVGKGYFGDAYRASYNGQDVVVKTIRASEFGESNDQILQEFQHEAAVLNMFGHHPCVVPFVGASTDIRYPLSIVTEYLPYGSLEDNLRQPNASEQFSIRQKTAMLKDAAAGLLNIHEGGFIHRDIAARNCLVDDNLRIKICDFGLCRRVSAVGGSLMKDTVGPVKYMAPESLQPPHLFSYDSDAYMFGVLMWETYTMSSPFASMTPVEAMLKVMNGERLAVPDNLPESLRSLMETCFHETPAQRPSMFEILSTLDSTLTSSNSKASAAMTAASASLSSATQLRQDRSIWV